MELPFIRCAIDADRKSMRHDDALSIQAIITDTFMRIQRAFERKTQLFGLEDKLESLANLTRKLNGFSFTGAGRTALDKACATTGLQWQIENGVLQVKMKGDTMTREVYLLSAETGLIGIPKKINRDVRR